MPETPLQQPEFYSQEDIQQILNIAIARRQDDGEALTRKQLWEIASELDIDRATIIEAEKDWLVNKDVDRQRQEFNLYRRHKFQHKLVKFLVSLNLLTGGTLSWSLYVLLFWGLGLSLNAWKTFQNRGSAYEKAFQRWQFQDRIKRTVGTVWDRVQRSLLA
jgi:2TM domain